MLAGFTDFFINKNDLSDEIGWFQLGYEDETEFYDVSHELTPY